MKTLLMIVLIILPGCVSWLADCQEKHDASICQDVWDDRHAIWAKADQHEESYVQHEDHGNRVYPESACIGAVVMGECHGSILSTDPDPERCYGEMIAGRCTGPQF